MTKEELKKKEDSLVAAVRHRQTPYAVNALFDFWKKKREKAIIYWELIQEKGEKNEHQ